MFLIPFVVFAGVWCISCTVPLGPGYSIESQQIRVTFGATSDPTIQVECEYKLRNSGNRTLASLELRLPGRRRFLLASSQATWDGTRVEEQTSPVNSRNTVLSLPKPWKESELHKLVLSADLKASEGDAGFKFSSDAFFLPSEGWAPELLPAEGLYSTGGVPPDQWLLSVRVPEGFLLHASGREVRRSRSGQQMTIVAKQGSQDRYPFVVSGLYREASIQTGNEKVVLWTRAGEEAPDFRQSTDALSRAIQAFNMTFGTNVQNSRSFWIVECPVTNGCLAATASLYSGLLGAKPGASELASQDTLMIELTRGSAKIAAAAPALAASWLGYGQNPAFYEQQPPLSALPAFASAIGEAAIDGPTVRTETIRRALRAVPRSAPSTGRPKGNESEEVLRAKSILFFYALQDRCGQDAFRHAINHMLSARRERGFNLDDLIAAFEQETNQNIAEFVRLWIKHPGVPDDFRARYEETSASVTANSKETTR